MNKEKGSVKSSSPVPNFSCCENSSPYLSKVRFVSGWLILIGIISLIISGLVYNTFLIPQQYYDVWDNKRITVTIWILISAVCLFLGLAFGWKNLQEESFLEHVQEL